jgi:hypothetical protein
MQLNLSKFVHSSTGKTLMSLLLGFGLATFFRSICKGRGCRVIKAPPMEEIIDQTYRFDNKCYKIKKNPIKCDNKKKTVKI